mmetsp:Transcript_14719/g.24626  ORF Transcript_14719/g.24626 Transcript_14719/m.24626 type:complete len:371 (+) Transcript_14719:41-1153(+)|eukprot:jgi/Bigna1/85307/estExt_fgenesh1_pg.C_30211
MARYAPKSVQEAWDNHFGAFGAKSMEKILLDYTDESVISVFNATTQNKEVFKGAEGAKKFFEELWGVLKDYSTLKAPVNDVDEKSRMVFLCWSCKGMGYEAVTDSFFFTPDFKILRQNIHVVTTPSCCPPNRCALLPPSDYKAKGKEGKLGKLNYYDVGTGEKGAVIVVPDVFGFQSGRHKGVCDELAGKGYYVIMPDFFHGSYFPKEPEKKMEFLKYWTPEKWQPDMDAVWSHLEKYPAAKIGMVGFCWGTWAIWHESARNNKKFSCGVNFHPSVNIEILQGRKIEDLAEKLLNPMLMAPCKGDHASLQENGASHEIMKKNSLGSEYIPFPSMNHGFVSQGDVSDKEILTCVTKAMDSSYAFLEKHMKQ